MISKSRKPPRVLSPISLPSTLGKFLECIIETFSNFALENNPLPPLQNGFYHKHSINSGPHSTKHRTKRRLVHTNHFFDLNHDFDSIWYKSLIIKLLFLKFPMANFDFSSISSKIERPSACRPNSLYQSP